MIALLLQKSSEELSNYYLCTSYSRIIDCLVKQENQAHMVSHFFLDCKTVVFFSSELVSRRGFSRDRSNDRSGARV